MRQNTVKSVIAASGVRVGNIPVVVGDHCLPPPKVTLTRKGQDVSSIEIRCGCGEVIVLECVYAESE
ncbi:MAG: hypothetical protein R3C49_09780 [Planctomycetaceae bacterium]